MMDNNEPEVKRENPLLGRKIFFVNPHIIFENYVVTDLRNNEYEVYVIDDYHDAKSILSEYKDALVFFYIDNGLTYDEWFNYIKSMQLDEKLKSIFVGVVSIKATSLDQQRFVMDLQLPGGFIRFSRDRLDITLKNIKDILDLNGAKGCRKYIRLDSKSLDKVNGYLAFKDKLYTFTVDNISSVGFACFYPEDMLEIFTKNIVHPSVSLTLGRRTIIASSVVFDTKIVNGTGFSVLLFTKDVDRDTRNEIRAFIFDVLDEKLKKSLSVIVSDDTDYTQAVTLPSDEKVPQFNEIQDSFIGELSEASAEDVAKTTAAENSESPVQEQSETKSEENTQSQEQQQ